MPFSPAARTGKSGRCSSGCPKPKEVVQMGNMDRLEKGANSQLSIPSRPCFV